MKKLCISKESLKESLKEILINHGIEVVVDENNDMAVSDGDTVLIPGIVDKHAPAATGNYSFERYSVPADKLKEVADFFLRLYEDELDAMNTDCIYEWYELNKWNWNLDGYDIDVYDQVESAILAGIEKRKQGLKS